MKVRILASVIMALAAASASANPVIDIPAGPIYIKFDNREQIALGGASTGYANEINWGLVQISSINVGTVTGPNVIETTGAPIFSNISSHNAQITGIFYGIEGVAPAVGNPFPATKGFLDLYWRDLDVLATTTDLASTAPTVRTSQSTATGYTDGTFLVRLAFASGIFAPDPNTFIFGSLAPTPGTGFVGVATSYSNVDTTAPGAWTDALNGDWFTTAFGTRDVRFRNIYEELGSWNSGCATSPTSCLLGARSTDPATSFAIPEPSTLALVGLTLLGFSFAGRRRKS